MALFIFKQETLCGTGLVLLVGLLIIFPKYL